MRRGEGAQRVDLKPSFPVTCLVGFLMKSGQTLRLHMIYKRLKILKFSYPEPERRGSDPQRPGGHLRGGPHTNLTIRINRSNSLQLQ